MSLQKFSYLILTLLFYFFLVPKAFAQIPAAETCALSSVVNLGTVGNYENQTFDFSVQNSGLTPVVNCPTTALPDNVDGWVTFQAASSGLLVVQYTPTVNKDIAIALYTGACGSLTSVQCVNNFQTGATESLSFNAVAGSQYRIRVVNATDNTAITGRMSAYMGVRAVGDLCTDAQEVGIGTCDYPFNIAGNFIQNEANDVACTTGTRVADGWLRIRVGNNKRIRVSYGSVTKDAMISIYGASAGAGFATFSQNNCNINLFEIACANNVVGIGNEFVEFDAGLAVEHYYIRISNNTDGNTMDGNLCVTEILARDGCASALSNGNFIKIGDCNVKFDVPRTYTAGGLTDPFCVTGGSGKQDAWVVLDYTTALGTTNLTLEYSSFELPNLVIYRKSAIQNCSNITGNDDIACASAGSVNFLNINFTVSPGNYYYIRVIRNTNSAITDMTGLMCLYDNTKRAEDNFFSAPTFSSSGSDCGKIFNTQLGFGSSGGLVTDNTASFSINCPSAISTLNDAWGRFDVGTLGAVSSIYVEYNNDNKDPSIANDVVLSVYRLPLVNAPLSADLCGGVTTLTLNSTLNMTVNGTNYGGTDIEGTSCDGGVLDANFGNDEWYTITTASQFSVSFETTLGDATLYVYTGTCVSLTFSDCDDGPIGAGMSSVIVSPSGSTTYHIRIINKTLGSNLTGKFSIFEIRPSNASMVQVDCANNVVEGTEQIVLTGATLQPNSIYFIRMANVGLSATTQGILCIRNDQVPDGDLCANAFNQLVGDCDLSFDVPLNYVNTPPIGIPVCNTAPSIAIGTVFRDVWSTFTATNTQTSIEYLSDKNSAIAVYRGSCNGLILVGCINALPTITGGIEKLKANTIVGLQYFVRVMDIDNNTSSMFGQLCIYNTTERDVCDDDDLVTNTVGMCNIPLDIPFSFDNSPVPLRNFQLSEGSPMAGQFPVVETGGSLTQQVQSTCEGGTDLGTAANPFENADNNPSQSVARDGWTRLIGNGSIVTMSYQNKEATSNPTIIVYTALKSRGPVNCSAGLDGAGLNIVPNLGANQYACANKINTNSIQTETVSFQTNSGQVYLIRVMNLHNDAAGMTGNICFADGRQDYEDPCANTIVPGNGGPRTINIGDCSVPLNVINGLNSCTDPAGTNTNYSGTTAGAGGCTADCAGTQDTWGRIRRNFICNEATANAVASPSAVNCAAAAIALTGDANFYKFNATTNTCQCGDNTVSPSVGGNFSVQYDNRDGLLTTPADVKISIYRENTGFDCNNEGTYTFLSCADAAVEGIENINITASGINLMPTTHGSGGEYYLIRVINKDATRSAYGTICTFFGTSLADISCPPTNDYGALEGNYRGFTVPGGTYSATSVPLGIPNRPTPNISLNGCVLAGGSNPVSLNPPIRSNAWMTFSVPSIATYTAVSVQYDNSGGSGTIQNSALAIYRMPNSMVGSGNCNTFSGTNTAGLELLDCANTVYVGTESSTFTITLGWTYFVRVMNVQGGTTNPSAMPGRIRVFPYAVCTAGPELVTDGTFAAWPAMTGTQPNSAGGGQATNGAFDTAQNGLNIKVPQIATTHPYNPTYVGPAFSVTANSLDYNTTTGIVRFATDYAFLRDVTNAGYSATGGVNGGIDATTATYLQLSGQRQELSPEGQYLVAHTPWTVKDNWFGYGNGYSGYGGRLGGTSGMPDLTYCNTGAVNEFLEPCIPRTRNPYPTTVGQYNTNTAYNRAQGTPITSDSNFMIINGSFDPAGGLPPGKVWCQTVDRAGGSVGYYVFSIWVQNMKATNSNSDVPMMRMSICDMENPTNGTLPTKIAAAGSYGSPVIESNGLVSGRSLPGITTPSLIPVRHVPAPPTNRLQAPRVQFSYGAARSCNIPTGAPGAESRDARLKILGSSFLVTENPDQWVLVRCIYRAPRDITEFNACIENLSLTKNGNDFAIDDISIRECLNPDAQSFDRMLRGDACQLTADPRVIGLPLGAEMIDFTGKLIGDRVLLNWAVANEYQVAKYEIQRSTNGTNYQKIGEVDAKGTQFGNVDYNFTDYNLPITAQGFVYYRLNMVDNNGTEKSGAIVSVTLKALDTFDLKLIPNPIESGDDVTLRYNVKEGKTVITVNDLLGSKLAENTFSSINGENNIALSTKGLQSGMYIIKMIHNGKSVSKKLVVK
ncbi:MAG: T9SS C-terminal target domain-containing protein [Cytophagia bacterium]|nr:MAG: T9SS C-terminal target domain-containing protein [Cytophagia bacterium]TAG44382.1 MAG: T9SS C-terminal target domain-containing protein [Cytophagia bacterium]